MASLPVDRAEMLLAERRVERPRKLHWRMLYVDDRVPSDAAKGVTSSNSKNLETKLRAFGHHTLKALQS